jgi:putative membrane protein insertion efficiency factor
MVFIGGWRSRRRGYGGYGGFGQRGYGRGYGSSYGPGYGRGYGGNSCLRDMCLLETGCCLAESLGCGPQLTLLAPQLLRRSVTVARRPAGREGPAGWLLGFALAAIALYEKEISPHRRPCCRYSPSCSHYAAEALERHGLRRGLWLTVRRLVRCRPGSAGGNDPVPPVRP